MISRQRVALAAAALLTVAGLAVPATNASAASAPTLKPTGGTSSSDVSDWTISGAGCVDANSTAAPKVLIVLTNTLDSTDYYVLGPVDVKADGSWSDDFAPISGAIWNVSAECRAAVDFSDAGYDPTATPLVTYPVAGAVVPITIKVTDSTGASSRIKLTDTITVESTGYTPGETVKFTINTTSIATLKADSNGKATWTGKIPASLQPAAGKKIDVVFTMTGVGDSTLAVGSITYVLEGQESSTPTNTPSSSKSTTTSPTSKSTTSPATKKPTTSPSKSSTSVADNQMPGNSTDIL